jgi:hypothetical protein
VLPEAVVEEVRRNLSANLPEAVPLSARCPYESMGPQPKIGSGLGILLM